MASPGQFTAGDVLAAADMNALPGGVLGYAERTTDQTGISAGVITDLTGLSVAVDVPAGRRIKITAKGSFDGTDARSQFMIREGSTELQSGRNFHTGGTAVIRERSIQISAIITPSSGAHTYKLSVEFVGASGNSRARPGEPAFILVEDLGPA